MIESVERHLLLEGIYLKYGYDFRQYSEVALNRRIDQIMKSLGIQSEVDLLAIVLKDFEIFHRILPTFTITTSEMFRDPTFFLSLRQNIVPILKTYANLNIWIAGCSTGEEVHSLAILLNEEGLLERSTIFATDINTHALKMAKEGIYNIDSIKDFTRNYVAAGGKGSPSDYYTVEYNRARMRSFLRENVVFAEHNLATDGVFIEANLILCRNVLIYFNRELQDRAMSLFHQSLAPRCFLALGSKETTRFSEFADNFNCLDKENKIYQKNWLQTKNGVN
ncbi:chemotaxis protein CheR [Bdellovibrio bacteriovorus]|uniref:Chemotaxis protein CheR n=1 Tax=Bdellovibrio bacteriovorus TaxID=959 RepID=A0A150WRA4_BDEBC|nr:CheR family methyltransferase [Bdellovibrio bacteriovorus]KYG67021.1 chemotaxis protein CheR [Bdellovibrio bacteriovorus]